MDENILRWIIYNPKLSKADSVYLLTILELNSRNEPITHQTVANLVGDAVPTTIKKFHSLRKRGWISAKRIGSTQWEYKVLVKDAFLKGASLKDNPPKERNPKNTPKSIETIDTYSDLTGQSKIYALGESDKNPLSDPSCPGHFCPSLFCASQDLKDPNTRSFIQDKSINKSNTNTTLDVCKANSISSSTLDVCKANSISSLSIDETANKDSVSSFSGVKNVNSLENIGSYSASNLFKHPLEIPRNTFGKESSMPLIAGSTDDVLGGKILAALAKSEKDKEEKEIRQEKKSVDAKSYPTVRRCNNNKQIAAMKKKEVSEYNCHDMWYVFKDSWYEHWTGHLKNWSGKEYRMAKEMIDNFTSEDTVGIIRYCVEHWGSIRTRHKTQSYPTFALIYSMRDQLSAEFYNGVLAPIGEYSHEYAHIGVNEWGC